MEQIITDMSDIWPSIPNINKWLLEVFERIESARFRIPPEQYQAMQEEIRQTLTGEAVSQENLFVVPA